MALPFSMVPWKNDETAEYRIRIRNEDGHMEDIGMMEFSLGGIKKERGIGTLEVSSLTQVTNAAFREESRLKINAGTFKPMICESLWVTREGATKVQAEYSGKQVMIHSSAPQGRFDHKLSIGKDAYDNAEVIHMFRALDWNKLHKEEFTIINIIAALKVAASVELVGLESVEVSAGKFECYRLRLELHNQQQRIDQYFLYDRNGSHLLVKHIAGVQVMELRSSSS